MPDAQTVEVLAAPVSHLDLLKASGQFYSGPPPLPSVTGSDGVGRLSDGRIVYFDAPIAPFGSMAEHTVVASDCLIDVPDGADVTTAAALGNAGLAAHTALEWRAGLKAGECVLVLGATGVVGRLAVQLARLMGAGRVIAAGRARSGLRRALQLGADQAVQLQGSGDLSAHLAGADVIVDLLWGAPAIAALSGAASGVRHVQLGQLAGIEATLAAPTVRSLAAEIRGHAVFHAPRAVRAKAYVELVVAAMSGRLELDVETLSLSEVERAYRRQAQGTGGTKLVLIP